MDRADWTLLAIAAAGGKPLQPIHLQKVLFLLGQKLPTEVGASYYAFGPYRYGAWAQAISRDADTLTAAGLVTTIPQPGRDWSDYAASNRGIERAFALRQSVPPRAAAYLDQLVLWARELTFDQVVHAVYAEYPEMKENSQFRGRAPSAHLPVPSPPDERTSQFQSAFLRLPGLLETVRASQEDERAGRYVTPEELQRQYEIED